MSETEVIAEVEATATEAEAPQGEAGTDWKTEARKWETRAKADHEAANKWREFETSQKSEYERLAERLAQAEATASEASAKAIRYEVATAKGIPAEALDLITGNDRETIEASADKLAALIAAQSKPNQTKPDPNQGMPATGGNSPKDQFAAAMGNLL